MDYRLSFAVVFLSVIVSPVLSASTTSNYTIVTDITIPISNETSTLPPSENGTTVTLPPSENGTTVTLPPSENGTTVTLPADNSTITIGPAANYTGTTETPREKTSLIPITIPTTLRPAKTSSGFDGGSFAGGIALGVVLVSIMFGVCYLCRRRKGSGNLQTPSVEY
ncbi:uncharacterized protein LOC110446784 [Mizuhopecten yessoensis]|uniref:Uncharacterized protein n=1 Tax=Mizuhopecten yessoensis TaxID=6573 RepID=A0A210QWQ5_MIZYE|nr:uncharacterized protein LOC110446784 [Mizuhopecten yessoensis]OWF53175.1 hypothetical protein KP79_PYT06982 [Mizuhopecten yessoensis]